MRRAHDTDRTAELIARTMELESRDAKAARAIGSMARALVQSTMPHGRTESHRVACRNGGCTLAMTAMQLDTGLSYGAMPRHLMQRIVTEAKRTGVRQLVLGASPSEFLTEARSWG